MKRVAALALALALSGSAAFADAMQDSIVAQLGAQGFSEIRINRTFLGRTRVIAFSDTLRREIIFNPNTGEILRDYWKPKPQRQNTRGNRDDSGRVRIARPAPEIVTPSETGQPETGETGTDVADAGDEGGTALTGSAAQPVPDEAARGPNADDGEGDGQKDTLSEADGAGPEDVGGSADAGGGDAPDTGTDDSTAGDSGTGGDADSGDAGSGGANGGDADGGDSGGGDSDAGDANGGGNGGESGNGGGSDGGNSDGGGSEGGGNGGNESENGG